VMLMLENKAMLTLRNLSGKTPAQVVRFPIHGSFSPLSTQSLTHAHTHTLSLIHTIEGFIARQIRNRIGAEGTPASASQRHSYHPAIELHLGAVGSSC